MKNLVKLKKVKKGVRDFLKSQAFKQLCILMLAVGTLYTVASGGSGSSTSATQLGSVASDIKNYLPTLKTIIYAIAAAVGLAGSIRIFIKMQSGDQDVQKSIVMLVGAIIFLIAAANVIPTLFGMNG